MDDKEVKNNVTRLKPNTITKTDKVSIQTYINPDSSITITKGKVGGKGKGLPGGRYSGKEIVK